MLSYFYYTEGKYRCNTCIWSKVEVGSSKIKGEKKLKNPDPVVYRKRMGDLLKAKEHSKNINCNCRDQDGMQELPVVPSPTSLPGTSQTTLQQATPAQVEESANEHQMETTALPASPAQVQISSNKHLMETTAQPSQLTPKPQVTNDQQMETSARTNTAQTNQQIEALQNLECDSPNGICKYYLSGSCKFDENCRYYHPNQQNTVTLIHDIDTANIKCKFYLSGTCKLNEYCSYHHPIFCKRFLKNLNDRSFGCKFGVNCKYFHPKLCYSYENKDFCNKRNCRYFHRRKATKYNSTHSRPTRSRVFINSSFTKNSEIDPPQQNHIASVVTPNVRSLPTGTTAVADLYSTRLKNAPGEHARNFLDRIRPEILGQIGTTKLPPHCCSPLSNAPQHRPQLSSAPHCTPQFPASLHRPSPPPITEHHSSPHLPNHDGLPLPSTAPHGRSSPITTKHSHNVPYHSSPPLTFAPCPKQRLSVPHLPPLPHTAQYNPSQRITTEPRRLPPPITDHHHLNQPRITPHRFSQPPFVPHHSPPPAPHLPSYRRAASEFFHHGKYSWSFLEE